MEIKVRAFDRIYTVDADQLLGQEVNVIFADRRNKVLKVALVKNWPSLSETDNRYPDRIHDLRLSDYGFDLRLRDNADTLQKLLEWSRPYGYGRLCIVLKGGRKDKKV